MPRVKFFLAMHIDMWWCQTACLGIMQKENTHTLVVSEKFTRNHFDIGAKAIIEINKQYLYFNLRAHACLYGGAKLSVKIVRRLCSVKEGQKKSCIAFVLHIGK